MYVIINIDEQNSVHILISESEQNAEEHQSQKHLLHHQ
jgi:hypothetical protein